MLISVFEANITILVSCIIGLLFAIYNAFALSKVKLTAPSDHVESYSKFQDEESEAATERKLQVVLEVAHYIEKGAKAFLYEEYKFILIFVFVMAIVIIFGVESTLGEFWITVAFLLGAFTSLLSGYIGMRVAVFSNYRCAFSAQYNLTSAFRVAYRAGCVMGFFLCSLGLLNLLILIAVYNNWYMRNYEDFSEMYDKIAGYGLGASTMALFGRVGGGIFTKAADVGADLVGKIEEDMAEDSPSNPATIADNVGDNVGDVAGMGADLFGSFAESTCAALVVASTSPSFFFHPSAIYYPLMISALCLLACLLTSLIALFISQTETYKAIGIALKVQLFVSMLLCVLANYIAASITLPDRIVGLSEFTREPWHAFVCTVFGTVSGFIIGLATEYYTSHNYRPVREVAHACETGAATNVIYGLALGYISTIIPITCLAVTAYISYTYLNMFGVALAALGMLSTLSIGLAIDCYGPVSDNAGGIAEMCDLGEHVRRRTDALDAAGNTTAAIGKGFAIGSAGLVSLALYGAFLTRSARRENNYPISNVDIISPLVFAGLLIGAMLPYAFSAMTLKSVGKAALQMVREIRRQLQANPEIRTGDARPDYDKCIKISTDASLVEMIAPGALVILTPLVIGIIIGPIAIAGLLPGALISGVAMATASANSGGAWDNAKKYIESGEFVVNGVSKKKGSEEHKAAIIGDTIGDPLKDTSGPALNILIKLMAILSLVFAGAFDQTAFLQCFLDPATTGCNRNL